MRRILEVNFALVVFLFISPLMAQDVEKGASLYKKCIVCHGKNGEGKRSQKAPRIGGQFDWYIYQQLKDIKSMVRKNDAMMPYVKNLSDQDFKDLSTFCHSMLTNNSRRCHMQLEFKTYTWCCRFHKNAERNKLLQSI